jgi:hypothetical protein
MIRPAREKHAPWLLGAEIPHTRNMRVALSRGARAR